MELHFCDPYLKCTSVSPTGGAQAAKVRFFLKMSRDMQKVFFEAHATETSDW